MMNFFKSLSLREGILGFPLVRRLVALPLDEASADRVVFQLVKRLVAGEQLRRHRVRVREVSLGSIEDDVFQSQIQTGRTDGHLVRLIGIRGQSVQELGRACGWSLAEQSGERRPVGAMTFPGSAETAEQMDLQRRSPLELIFRKLGYPLEEIIRDSHRAHGVRTRGSRAHLVEFVEHRHDRALALLDHVEFRRHVGSGRCRGRPRRRRAFLSCFLLRAGAAGQNRSSGGSQGSAPDCRRLNKVALSCFGEAGAHVPQPVVLQLPQPLAGLLMTFNEVSMVLLLSRKICWIQLLF